MQDMYLELAINDEAKLDNHEKKNKGQSYMAICWISSISCISLLMLPSMAMVVVMAVRRDPTVLLIKANTNKKIHDSHYTLEAL